MGKKTLIALEAGIAFDPITKKYSPLIFIRETGKVLGTLDFRFNSVKEVEAINTDILEECIQHYREIGIEVYYLRKKDDEH